MTYSIFALCRHRPALLWAALTVMAASGVPHAWADAVFKDPLDVPAISQKRLTQKPLMAVASLGQSLVAVGMRGLIIRSDDQGLSWTQARVPVQSDLLAVQFASEQQGWAVGHDGVVLHSADGGRTWAKQLDGRQAAQTLSDYYQKRIDAGERGLQSYVEHLAMNFQAGPSLPFLGVWFDDAENGYAVGAFGTLISSTVDGGKSWQPALERIDNPDALHLNAITRIGAHLYIAAERGHVFRLNPQTQRFEALDTGYAGGLFGLDGNARQLLVYGLGGKAFISTDQGQSWQAVANTSGASLTGSTYLPEQGRFVLVSSAGQILSLESGSASLQPFLPPMRTLLTDVVDGGRGELITTGLSGSKATLLNQSAVSERK
uniref:Photosynthesis system II assembly factor Ycf48/Hcf136-like domain-containing protein n=1 Tax=Pseudomonas sp. HI-70 TaxID=341693 RepID=T2HVX0_9PSED|nr:hypothetical protein [Pseudomonas sp. HI-70]